MNLSQNKVLIIGAGLAGADASWYLAKRGINVVLCECKVIKPNPAQKIKTFAELVCTNSLKSIKEDSGHGILKYDMKKLGSLILEVGFQCSVPAGDALAVDRNKFSQEITKKLSNHPNIATITEEVINPIETAKKYGCSSIIIATGPLTTQPLEEWIRENIAQDDFYFYDAIAPVVDADSLNMDKLYFKDRNKKNDEENEASYLNAPMTKKEYEDFVCELKNAEKVPPQKFEDYKFFEACLPVDIMAERGIDTPRYSCMKPLGLEKENGEIPYACVQLRKENLLGSFYNMVGFQTRLTYKEQVRVFRMIPGFENASFVHLGSVHRNSFINSRKLLNRDMSSKKFPEIYFAGQITGVEGYTESAAMGLYVSSQIYRKICNLKVANWPIETGIGALVNYIMTVPKPVPSNINFGLFPPVTLDKSMRKNRKTARTYKKKLVSLRAKKCLDENFEVLT